MRISDWSSDVCSSDLPEAWTVEQRIDYLAEGQARFAQPVSHKLYENPEVRAEIRRIGFLNGCQLVKQARKDVLNAHFVRSEERRVGKECVRTCRSGWSPYH